MGNSDSKDKRLIKDFFKENLSKKEKRAFLKRASSDKEFVKDFVSELEMEVQSQVSLKEEDEN